MRASIAWADESFQEHDTTGFYIIAAMIIPTAMQEPARAQMLRAQARHAPAKLHWVARDDKERLELAHTVAGIDGLHVVAVGSPVHQRRQERARAYCLHQLVLELHRFGVEQLFMEARQPTLNTRDVTTVQHARYTLPKGTRFRVDHLPGASEALLWIADIVAGAVRAEKLGDSRYREILGEKVIDFPVTVR